MNQKTHFETKNENNTSRHLPSGEWDTVLAPQQLPIPYSPYSRTYIRGRILGNSFLKYMCVHDVALSLYCHYKEMH